MPELRILPALWTQQSTDSLDSRVSATHLHDDHMRHEYELTIIIPTIPEREALLAEALASVKAQTTPCSYKVGIDTQHQGPAGTVNSLASCVETEWLFRLDDDDLLDPDHVEVISRWLTDDVDIVYTWCRVEGDAEHGPGQFQIRPQDVFGWEHIHTVNWIPCSAAVRTDLFNELGGLRDVDEEDWDFWKRAYDAGATFSCVPAVTWTYRMNPEWSHRSGELLRRMYGQDAESDRVHEDLDHA